MKRYLTVLFGAVGLILPGVLTARTVTCDTVVCNPGAVVTVPVTIDDASDVGAVLLTVSYDATIAVCLGVDAGRVADATRMSSVDTGSGHVVILCPQLSGQGSGEIARLRFCAREGAQGQFSDVTLANVEVASEDGLRDLSVENPLRIVNGMIRVAADDAEVTRLEAPFTIAPETRLRTVSLGKGDGLRASDRMESPVVVSGDVSAIGPIPVSAPVDGWQNGRYALLSTMTDGLSFSFPAVEGVAFGTVEKAVAEGRVTYWIGVTVEGEIEIVANEGALPPEVKSRVRNSLAAFFDEHPAVRKVVVKGGPERVSLVSDLGICPRLVVAGAEATAEYADPALVITEFDPKSGRIRIKVTPGEGNEIRTSMLTGCIGVYGSDTLSERMTRLEKVRIDLTPYLKSETKGEADLTVTLGTKRFFAVTADAIGQ